MHNQNITATQLATYGLLISGDAIRGNGRRRAITAPAAYGHIRPGKHPVIGWRDPARDLWLWASCRPGLAVVGQPRG